MKKITEPKPDLVFLSNRGKDSSGEFSRGDLFDLSSGNRIREDLVDYSDLISKYRPNILHMNASWFGYLRSLAIRGLFARFLNWFINSRAPLIIYLLLTFLPSTLVIYFAYAQARTMHYIGIWVWLTGFSVLLPSVATLILARKWQTESKTLVKKRPDERVLIFFVYIVFAMVYPLILFLVTNSPEIIYRRLGTPSSSDWLMIPRSWAWSWLAWTIWFSILTGLLGFGYICIHREAETVNTYFYDNSSNVSDISGISPFKESKEKPPWLNPKETKAFWVFRFMYYWRLEITLPRPHFDWERVEVWVDAENGEVKWIVSDYHYRELWYKVKGQLPNLYVRFLPSFHTPIPVVDSGKADLISKVFNQKKDGEDKKIPLRTLIKLAITGKTRTKRVAEVERDLTLPTVWTEYHKPEWIRKYLEDIRDPVSRDLCAKFFGRIPWTYWRYVHGVEKPIDSRKAEWYRDNPATYWNEQPGKKSKLREKDLVS